MTPGPERRDRSGGPVDAVSLRVGDGETITEQARRNVLVLAERHEISITWSRYAPGERGPDLHVHLEHTDAFYVLEGELTFVLGPGADRVRVPAGGFAAVPPRVVHSFVNEGGADACWLNMHAPDTGFAAYLRDVRDGEDAAFDSFDPPADGGLPAAGVIVTGPGEGERMASGDRVVVLKGVMPDLCVAEWVHGGPRTGAPVPRGARYAFAHGSAGTATVIDVHAPGGGFADLVRSTWE
jgi:quercetin dioxygenase-like cupin family protein